VAREWSRGHTSHDAGIGLSAAGRGRLRISPHIFSRHYPQCG
jgi:hypothetical protein